MGSKGFFLVCFVTFLGGVRFLVGFLKSFCKGGQTLKASKVFWCFWKGLGGEKGLSQEVPRDRARVS